MATTCSICVDVPRYDSGLVQRVLHALADRFDGDGITVDRKVFNPSRLTKLYGTLSRKGIATPERPHRPSAVMLRRRSCLLHPRSCWSGWRGRH